MLSIDTLNHSKIVHLLADNVRAYERTWIIGDGFLAHSYQQYFFDVWGPQGKLPYLLAHTDSAVFCHENRQNLPGNILSRLRNLLVCGINDEILLPKAILIILDDDMMDDLDHYDHGITNSIGRMIEWIMNEMHRIINDHKNKLPSKARKFKFPTVLWYLIPLHEVYDQYSDFKKKFNKAVITTSKLFREVQYVQLDSSSWNFKDESYFANGRFTADGLKAYWHGINQAYKNWDRIQMKNLLSPPVFGQPEAGCPRTNEIIHPKNWHRERPLTYDKNIIGGPRYKVQASKNLGFYALMTRTIFLECFDLLGC